MYVFGLVDCVRVYVFEVCETERKKEDKRGEKARKNRRLFDCSKVEP